jgi:hypothetical protein
LKKSRRMSAPETARAGVDGFRADRAESLHGERSFDGMFDLFGFRIHIAFCNVYPSAAAKIRPASEVLRISARHLASRSDSGYTINAFFSLKSEVPRVPMY